MQANNYLLHTYTHTYIHAHIVIQTGAGIPGATVPEAYSVRPSFLSGSRDRVHRVQRISGRLREPGPR